MNIKSTLPFEMIYLLESAQVETFKNFKIQVLFNINDFLIENGQCSDHFTRYLLT